jgi:hypothetical protein
MISIRSLSLDRIRSVRASGRSSAWGLVQVAGGDHLVRAIREGETVVVAPAGFLLPRPDALDHDPSPVRVPRGAPVTAVVADQAMRHEREVLPPVSKGQIQKAVVQKRRALAVQRGGAEVCLITDEPADPRQLLVVSAPQTATVAARDRAISRGYRVRRLTSAAVSLASLLRASEGEGAPGGATIMVHVSERIGTVACVRGGRLLLAREFRIPRPEGETEAPTIGPQRIDHIVGEIARSQLFFNHELSGIEQRRIFVSGDVDGTDELVAACRERFEVPVLATLDALDLDLSPFGPGPMGRHRALRWSGAIAAAVDGLDPTPTINLLPARDRAHQEIRRTVATWTGLFVLVASGLGVAQMGLLGAERATATDLESARRGFLAVEEEVARLAEVREARDAAARIQGFLDGRRASIRITEEAIRALSIAAPDSLTIDRVDIDCAFVDPTTSGVLMVEIQGTVTGVDAVAAQHDFNRFVSDLRKTTLFEGAALEPFESHPRGGAGGATLRFQLSSRVAG